MHDTKDQPLQRVGRITSRRTLHTPSGTLKAKPDRMAFALCSDRNLFWQSTFAMLRHVKLSAGRPIDHYYYVSDPLPEPYESLLAPHVTIRHWDQSIDYGDYGRPAHITHAALLRILAFDELCESYDKVAYCDSDTFLRWGSFYDLARLNMGDASLAAVREAALWHNETVRWNATNYYPFLPPNTHGRYFNSGMIVANAPAYKRADISGKALAFLHDHPELCHFGDQSALNAALDGAWAELSPSWNWQADPRRDHLIASRNPRLIHFAGPNKPWQDPMREFDELYFFLMREFLNENGLSEDLNALEAAFFQAGQERKRSRLLDRGNTAHMANREAVKAYLNRDDFVDVAQGIPSYGWEAD